MRACLRDECTIVVEFKQALKTSGKFDIIEKPGKTFARRRRILPLRGLFRLLFPLSIVRWLGDTKFSIRPDGWGWFMLVVCIAGVVTELTMPRARFPRGYPPAFIFVLTGIYVFNLVFDLYLTHQALRKIFPNRG